MKYNLICYGGVVNAPEYGNGNTYFYIYCRHPDKFVETSSFVEQNL